MIRVLVALCLGGLLGRPAVARATNEVGPTARQIVAEIQHHLGVTVPASTVDTFKAGNPDAPVNGITVTMMATYEVLEKAAASGLNLVITHEPTFYNHLDQTATLTAQNDAVLREKQQFIADHNLVVWRFHDGWHLRRPDGILLGMAKSLGWLDRQNPAEPHLFELPETSLAALASEIRRSLHIRVLRTVGDPDLKVSRIALLPGAAGSAQQIALLERSDVQVLIIGETPEWETVEYVADAQSEHRPKAMLILGHIPSEQAGMEECASWLRTFITSIPVRFTPAREPFWLPKD